jgi:hypothetical protein
VSTPRKRVNHSLKVLESLKTCSRQEASHTRVTDRQSPMHLYMQLQGCKHLHTRSVTVQVATELPCEIPQPLPVTAPCPTATASMLNQHAINMSAQVCANAHVRQQQVEQRPQLLELVLQRRARQQQAARCRELGQVLAQLRLAAAHKG